jgi:O-acetyl-ADP-ribose deacetylase (regulator of RNase III)
MKFVTGSILDSRLHCVVNPVNCVGVMGKGLALDFRRRYPGMYKYYKSACAKGDLSPGLVDFWPNPYHPFQFICLFPTKNHWTNKSTIDILDMGLTSFKYVAETLSITEAAFPMIGCGLGGLDFERHVLPLMVKHFDNTPFDIHVYVKP